MWNQHKVNVNKKYQKDQLEEQFMIFRQVFEQVNGSLPSELCQSSSRYPGHEFLQWAVANSQHKAFYQMGMRHSNGVIMPQESVVRQVSYATQYELEQLNDRLAKGHLSYSSFQKLVKDLMQHEEALYIKVFRITSTIPQQARCYWQHLVEAQQIFATNRRCGARYRAQINRAKRQLKQAKKRLKQAKKRFLAIKNGANSRTIKKYYRSLVKLRHDVRQKAFCLSLARNDSFNELPARGNVTRYLPGTLVGSYVYFVPKDDGITPGEIVVRHSKPNGELDRKFIIALLKFLHENGVEPKHIHVVNIQQMVDLLSQLRAHNLCYKFVEALKNDVANRYGGCRAWLMKQDYSDKDRLLSWVGTGKKGISQTNAVAKYEEAVINAEKRRSWWRVVWHGFVKKTYVWGWNALFKRRISTLNDDSVCEWLSTKLLSLFDGNKVQKIALAESCYTNDKNKKVLACEWQPGLSGLGQFAAGEKYYQVLARTKYDYTYVVMVNYTAKQMDTYHYRWKLDHPNEELVMVNYLQWENKVIACSSHDFQLDNWCHHKWDQQDKLDKFIGELAKSSGTSRSILLDSSLANADDKKIKQLKRLLFNKDYVEKVVNDKFIDRAEWFILLVLLDDDDTIGSRLQNKAMMADDQGYNWLFMFDIGKALRRNNVPLINSMKSDFSCSTKGYKNYSAIYQGSSHDELMKGVYLVYKILAPELRDELFTPTQQQHIEEIIQRDYLADDHHFAEKYNNIQSGDYCSLFAFCRNRYAGYSSRIHKMEKRFINNATNLMKIFKGNMQCERQTIVLLGQLQKLTSNTTTVQHGVDFVQLQVVNDRNKTLWKMALDDNGEVILTTEVAGKKRAAHIADTLLSFAGKRGRDALRLKLADRLDYDKGKVTIKFPQYELAKFYLVFSQKEIENYKQGKVVTSQQDINDLPSSQSSILKGINQCGIGSVNDEGFEIVDNPSIKSCCGISSSTDHIVTDEAVSNYLDMIDGNGGEISSLPFWQSLNCDSYTSCHGDHSHNNNFTIIASR